MFLLPLICVQVGGWIQSEDTGLYWWACDAPWSLTYRPVSEQLCPGMLEGCPLDSPV